jgi:hypothetical protein
MLVNKEIFLEILFHLEIVFFPSLLQGSKSHEQAEKPKLHNSVIFATNNLESELWLGLVSEKQ